MKKIILLGLMSILFVGITFAQTRIGITAGLNASNVTTNNDDVSFDYKAGFQAGLVTDFAITENFSVIPELLFSQRGFKMKVGVENIEASVSTTLNYLQLPINLAYKFDVGYGSKLFIFAGPYVGYGISTSVSGKAKGFTASSSNAVKFGSKDGEINPLDFGLNVGIGYQYEKVFFKCQFNPGFANLSNVKDVTSKNINVAVTAGYFFN